MFRSFSPSEDRNFLVGKTSHLLSDICNNKPQIRWFADWHGTFLTRVFKISSCMLKHLLLPILWGGKELSIWLLNLYLYAAQKCLLIKTENQSFPFINSLESLDLHLDKLVFLILSEMSFSLKEKNIYLKTLKIIWVHLIFLGLMSVLGLNCLYRRPTFLPYLIIFLSFWKIFNSGSAPNPVGLWPCAQGR